MPHTVVGSEQRRRRGRPLSSRDRTFTSAPTQIVNVPYAYCGGGTVHRVVPVVTRVRAGSVTAVRIPLCGDTCAQMRKASCSVRPCRLAVKNVPSYAATAVRDRCLPSSLGSPFSARLATHATWKSGTSSPFSRWVCAQHGLCTCRRCGAAAPEARAHGHIAADIVTQWFDQVFDLLLSLSFSSIHCFSMQ